MPKNTKKQPRRPAPPSSEFPLYRHANGQWAKRVRGKLFYFGTDAEKALTRWADSREDLLAGRVPRAISGEGATVRDLLNHFLAAKESLIASGELSPRSFAEYRNACAEIAKAFGLGRRVDDLLPDDFGRLRSSFAARFRSPTVLGNKIQKVRTVFKYAFEAFLVDRPVGRADRLIAAKLMARDLAMNWLRYKRSGWLCREDFEIADRMPWSAALIYITKRAEKHCAATV